jgi:hypothetical protein
MSRISRAFPGLPAAATVEQSILLAQLQILRQVQAQQTSRGVNPHQVAQRP